jgi:mannosyltransferase OCH1-like enzyme
MSEFKNLMINSINNSPIWSMLENNYDNHYIKTNIPKIIHQVWLGGAIPDKYKRLRDTWIEKNPDWQYKLWTDEDVDKFGLENIEQFNKINNLGAKSDIFRYEILYHQGGLYVDTDFECLKSFDDLLHLDFFSGTGHVNEPEVFNGLIACKPKHNLIRKIIDDIKVVSTNNFDEIIALTGPKYFSSKLFEYIQNNPTEKIVIFPTTYFYPFPAVHRYEVRIDNLASRAIVKKFNTDESYCTHLWYTSWQK